MQHREDEPLTAYLVTQKKSLEDDPLVPRWVKALLRWVYFRYGWAATDHNGKSYCKTEYRGIYDTAEGARMAAMVPGGGYHELPLNCALPEETCQFGVHDFPLSSASPEYRSQKPPFVAIAREDLELLEQKVHEVVDCAEGKCVARAV
jgi:hypothetical protein